MEFLIVLFGAILVHLLASELTAHAPALARMLLRVAVARLPSGIRDRYREEWSAHADECPGALAKMLFGIECVLCAHALGRVAHGARINFFCGADDDQSYIVSIEDESMAVDGGTALHILGSLLSVLKMSPHPDQMEGIRDLERGIAALKESLGGNEKPTPALLKEWSVLMGRVHEKRNAQRESSAPM